MSMIAAPPGMDATPDFDRGWLTGEDPAPTPFLTFAPAATVNWSDEFESMHEENSRTHFMDVWTRQAISERVGALASTAVVLDVGCSTGYLLEDLRAAHRQATLIGVDLVAAGLRRAHALVPTARLLLADACDLPLGDGTVDAVVSANMLEHVRDDRKALAEMRRVLRRGGRAVIVVPAGPSTYDYYDRFLGHERRYGRHELARKGVEAGLVVLTDTYIASLLYPAFWLIKQRNRRWHNGLKGAALAERVSSDIAGTEDSRVGKGLRTIEERLGLRLPFGIRNVVSLRREGQ